jgi:hypothetical protein
MKNTRMPSVLQAQAITRLLTLVQVGDWRKYALEAIIILLLSYFLFMIMFIFHTRIVLSGNINTCVVCEQHGVPSMPLLD